MQVTYHILSKVSLSDFKEAIVEYVKQQVDLLCKQPDHGYLVVEIPPKYAVSESMGYLKGKLAVRLFQQYESLAKRYWGRYLWAHDYCVSTIYLDEEKISKYVQ